MSDRPILMSAPMVRALLDGRKTQTRRLAWRETKWKTFVRLIQGKRMVDTIWQSVKPGDRLYVRETWVHGLADLEQLPVYYRADGEDECTVWRPSIHMNRRYSRLTLVVTATKMERVQAISDEDAEAEGAFELSRTGDDPMHPTWTMTGESWRYNTPRSAFESIWCILNTKPGARWEDNPEVVAVTFTVHQQNIDTMESAA